MLYIVPTPVGNLGDMTYRGVEVLRKAELILAEDTHSRRTAQVNAHRHYTQLPQVPSSFFVLEGVMERLEQGAEIALVSDAGTPGISDPGFMLARECRRGIPVTTLPGATALIPAIVSSGLPTDRFVFEGFLPEERSSDTPGRTRHNSCGGHLRGFHRLSRT